MLNKISLLSLGLTLTPLVAFASLSTPSSAQNEWANGQFEVNALYGRADKELDNANFYGASVAGGYYFGDHLLQLEVGFLLSEEGRGPAFSAVNPNNPAQIASMNYKEITLQDVPVWFNYRYGVSFGPSDCCRLEAGPVVGARVVTMRSQYDLTITEPLQPTRSYQDVREQSGDVVFDYGLAATLRIRLSDHWGIQAGYRYIRSTKAEFDNHVQELDSSTVYISNRLRVDAHATQYASLGVEYRF